VLGRLQGRIHVLVFVGTPKGIRVISFRKANAREVSIHGQETRPWADRRRQPGVDSPAGRCGTTFRRPAEDAASQAARAPEGSQREGPPDRPRGPGRPGALAGQRPGLADPLGRIGGAHGTSSACL